MSVHAESLFNEELYLLTSRTLVIIAEPWNDHAEADRELLNKILTAARLSLAHVRVIHQSKLDLGAIADKPAHVIYFGPAVTGLSPFECIRLEGTSVVLSPGLASLHTDAAAKQKLWVALKQLFAL